MKKLKFIGTMGDTKSTAYVNIGDRQYSTKNLPSDVVAEIEKRYNDYEVLVAEVARLIESSHYVM